MLKVFETFAGIGSQNKALSIIKNKYGYDYEISAISEWDVYTNISYNYIHHKKSQKKVSETTIEKYLENFTHSLDGKTKSDFSKIKKLNYDTKVQLYYSYKNTNNLGSILDITGEKLINSVGNINLLTYSFPCQDLSVSGSFHGFNKGMKKGSGTRSSLLWEIERLLYELKEMNKLPEFLLLENVKNMISKKHIEHYNEFKKSLKDLGYSTKTFCLNAKDYGIPQNRERVYGLSIFNYKGKVDQYGEIIDIDNNHLQKDIISPKTLKDIIKEDYSNSIYKQEALSSQPKRTPSRKKMFDLNNKLNHFHKYKYSRTVTTKQDRHPNAGIVDLENTILDNKNRNGYANYRFITPREAYLLMGFDEKDFDKIDKKIVAKEKLLHQAGNSIVVNAITSIMKLIQELFNEK